MRNGCTYRVAARDIGAKLIVFNIPELRELKPYPFADVTAKVKAVVDAQGVTFVDLLPGVENLEPSTLWVTVPDPHPNANAMTAFTRDMISRLQPMLDEMKRERGLD